MWPIDAVRWLATLAVGVNVPVRLAYWCCWLLLATLLDCAACAPALGMLGVFATVVVWCRWGQCVIKLGFFIRCVSCACYIGVIGRDVPLHLANSLVFLELVYFCIWPTDTVD